MGHYKTRLHPQHEDVAVKKKVNAIKIVASAMVSYISSFSSWFRAKRAVAIWLRLKQHLRSKVANRRMGSSITTTNGAITLHEMESAEAEIIRITQNHHLGHILNTLKSKGALSIFKKMGMGNIYAVYYYYY